MQVPAVVWEVGSAHDAQRAARMGELFNAAEMLVLHELLAKRELVPHIKKYIYLLLEVLKRATLYRTVDPTILSYM